MRIIEGPAIVDSSASWDEGDLPLAALHRDEHAPERVEVAAEVAQVADVHRVPLAALEGRADVFAADRGLEDHLGLVDGEPVARQLVAASSRTSRK